MIFRHLLLGKINNPRPGYRFRFSDLRKGDPCDVEFIHIVAVRANKVKLEIYKIFDRSYVNYIIPHTAHHEKCEFTRMQFLDFMSVRRRSLHFLDSKAQLDNIHG